MSEPELRHEDEQAIFRRWHTTAAPRPNWAVIMAGGQGRRLRPITESIPKPMVPVGGRPILEHLVCHLAGHGIRTLYLALGYLGHLIEGHFRDGSRFGCDIRYLREETPLGTAGALALLDRRPADPVLTLNGDLFTRVNVSELLAFHEAGPWRATLAVQPYVSVLPYGCVAVEGSRVVNMTEKPAISHLVNTGVYVLHPDLIGRIPRGESLSMPELLGSCLAKGEPVGAFALTDDWIDVGTPEQLLRAQAAHEHATQRQEDLLPAPTP